MLLVKEGRFSWRDLMIMPSWERKWYAEKLMEISKERNEKMKNSKNHK